MLLSGGVDSTVCTALLNRALNRDQVIAVHIDNGFMRKRESQAVEEALKKLGIQVKGTAFLLTIPYPTHGFSQSLPSVLGVIGLLFPDSRTAARSVMWNHLNLFTTFKPKMLGLTYLIGACSELPHLFGCWCLVSAGGPQQSSGFVPWSLLC